MSKIQNQDQQLNENNVFSQGHFTDLPEETEIVKVNTIRPGKQRKDVEGIFAVVKHQHGMTDELNGIPVILTTFRVLSCEKL